MIAAGAYWIGMGVALVIGLLYFRDLGDVSQMLIRVKRESMKRFIRNEYRFIALGFAGLVLMNEYKRRQAPPGVRVTHRAFGRDRRYPITSGWKDSEIT